MQLPNEWASKITDKNPKIAQKAAKHIISNKDLEAWSCLADNEEHIFDFIKNKVTQYLIDEVTEENTNNLFALMNRYNSWLADVIALASSKFDSPDINDKMLQYLIGGGIDQQAYAARYFAYVKFEPAETVLIKHLDSENENLKVNSAEALGAQKSKNAFEILFKNLDSLDDWQKLEAAELLCALGNTEALKPILKAMTTSSMKENLASEAASLCCLADYLYTNDEELHMLILEAFDHIVVGLPEILPLQNLLVYDFYECIDKLLKLAEEGSSIYTSKYAQILLRARYKFDMIINNDQYTFDENKETLEELKHIHNILTLRDNIFWDDMAYFVLEELDCQDIERKSSAIATIGEANLTFAENKLIKIITNEFIPEELLCQTACVLQEIKATNAIPGLKKLIERVTDANRLAIIKNTIKVLEQNVKNPVNTVPET